jgi:hypothetical protein
VYIDTVDARRTADDLARQRAETARLERRVQTLEREKTQLMESAETNMRRASICAEGERKAILGREQARDEAAVFKRRLAQLERDVKEQRLVCVCHLRLCSKLTSPLSRSPAPVPSPPPPRPLAPSRTINDMNKRLRLTTSREELRKELRYAEHDEDSSPVGTRPTRPLPRRVPMWTTAPSGSLSQSLSMPHSIARQLRPRDRTSLSFACRPERVSYVTPEAEDNSDEDEGEDDAE